MRGKPAEQKRRQKVIWRLAWHWKYFRMVGPAKNISFEKKGLSPFEGVHRLFGSEFVAAAEASQKAFRREEFSPFSFEIRHHQMRTKIR